MEKFQNEERLLEKLPIIQPDNFLFGRIMLQIEKNKKFILRINLLLYGTFCSSFIFLAFYSWKNILLEFQQTEIFRILSLFYSDSSMVLANWKSYTLYIAESLPYASIMIILSFLLLIMFSFKVYYQAFGHSAKLSN